MDDGMSISTAIKSARVDYQSGYLGTKDLSADPFEQFSKWLGQAMDSELEEANAMSVSTVDEQNRPILRTVLLRQFDAKGFVFYTNFGSRKSQNLAKNPNVALLFHWQPLHRQVAIRGVASKVDVHEAREYFHSRPRDSQLGAWASMQSVELADRNELDQRYAYYADKFSGVDVPLPQWWGGWRVQPLEFEFWQGRSSRLHDRFVYLSTTFAEFGWEIRRLYP